VTLNWWSTRLERCVTKNKLLRAYRHRVWDLFESFDALNLQVIPRKLNVDVDQLAMVGAQFSPPIDLFQGPDQHVKVVVRPIGNFFQIGRGFASSNAWVDSANRYGRLRELPPLHFWFCGTNGGVPI